LKDEEVKLIVPWSLEEIGDASAISALIEALASVYEIAATISAMI